MNDPEEHTQSLHAYGSYSTRYVILGKEANLVHVNLHSVRDVPTSQTEFAQVPPTRSVGPLLGREFVLLPDSIIWILLPRTFILSLKFASG